MWVVKQFHSISHLYTLPAHSIISCPVYPVFLASFPHYYNCFSYWGLFSTDSSQHPASQPVRRTPTLSSQALEYLLRVRNTCAQNKSSTIHIVGQSHASAGPNRSTPPVQSSTLDPPLAGALPGSRPAEPPPRTLCTSRSQGSAHRTPRARLGPLSWSNSLRRTVLCPPSRARQQQPEPQDAQAPLCSSRTASPSPRPQHPAPSPPRPSIIPPLASSGISPTRPPQAYPAPRHQRNNPHPSPTPARPHPRPAHTTHRARQLCNPQRRLHTPNLHPHPARPHAILRHARRAAQLVPRACWAGGAADQAQAARERYGGGEEAARGAGVGALAMSGWRGG
ncbi:hypothetical protein EJ07DRAFT_157621 [Lizonia empirigonia]|nr:hypothetical protein EJ07DRAFT_157621 [Lizonia empirigonia]